jgi:sugar lactone lactonase YvrE
MPLIQALAMTFAAFASTGWAATILVGNTSANNIVIVDTAKARVVREFIAAGAGGLVSPDDMNYGPDGNLYVSSGTDTGGAILRFDGRTGAFIDVFATSPSLKRPYGHAFGPDGKLYVSSFRSDEILRFDAVTGQFIDVFAAGNGTANGLNGPNDLLFGPDGALYVTTQGSVADGQGGISFDFTSQVLRYDIATGIGAVFADQPAPDPVSFGFVSLLGLAIGPGGTLWVSDFASGLLVYDLTGSLLERYSTNYTGVIPANNFVGNLLITDDAVLVAAFDFTRGNLGAILRYDPLTGAPLPGPGVGAGFPLLLEDARLVRSIGLVQPVGPLAPIPLPGAGLMLASSVVLLLIRRHIA